MKYRALVAAVHKQLDAVGKGKKPVFIGPHKEQIGAA